jgi:hypothetical protein
MKSTLELIVVMGFFIVWSFTISILRLFDTTKNLIIKLIKTVKQHLRLL